MSIQSTMPAQPTIVVSTLRPEASEWFPPSRDLTTHSTVPTTDAQSYESVQTYQAVMLQKQHQLYAARQQQPLHVYHPIPYIYTSQGFHPLQPAQSQYGSFTPPRRYREASDNQRLERSLSGSTAASGSEQIDKPQTGVAATTAGTGARRERHRGRRGNRAQRQRNRENRNNRDRN